MTYDRLIWLKCENSPIFSKNRLPNKKQQPKYFRRMLMWRINERIFARYKNNDWLRLFFSFTFMRVKMTNRQRERKTMKGMKHANISNFCVFITFYRWCQAGQHLAFVSVMMPKLYSNSQTVHVRFCVSAVCCQQHLYQCVIVVFKNRIEFGCFFDAKARLHC